MINAIIFDFGDVFINLDKETTESEFKKLGLESLNDALLVKNDLFEKGKITEEEFLGSFQTFIPNATSKEIKKAWNTILGDFPLYRLEFLQMLAGKYRLFLLSNTDSIHIKHFEKKYGPSFTKDFYQCFERVYFSYEMGMRKPDEAIYNYVLIQNELTPRNTLFVDDKKANIDSAKALGIQVWNLQVGQEDVVDLFEIEVF
jgi:putative hydrolase of the HAD superfamily